MSTNKTGSINKYTVGTISKVSTNTSITRRPYDGTSSYSEKKDDKSNSFKRTLKSEQLKESPSHENGDFSNLLSNELNDRLILDSRETLRVINTNFNNITSNENKYTPKESSPELHSKLRDAMKTKVDTSKLYKKLQLLNSLKSDSND